MSAYGFIALENENKDYVRLLIQYDSHPQNMLTNLIMLINRDGIETVRTTLANYPVWTSIVHNQVDIANVTPNQNAPLQSAERCAWEEENYGMAFIPGYGCHYDDDTDNHPHIVKNTGARLEPGLFQNVLCNFGYIVRENGDIETYSKTYPKEWKVVGTTRPGHHTGKTEQQLRSIITATYVPA